MTVDELIQTLLGLEGEAEVEIVVVARGGDSAIGYTVIEEIILPYDNGETDRPRPMVAFMAGEGDDVVAYLEDEPVDRQPRRRNCMTRRRSSSHD